MQRAKENYETAISAEKISSTGTLYKNELFQYQEALDDVNKRRKIGIPLMVVSFGATIFHIFKSSKKKIIKPVYEEEGSPFSSIKLEPNMSYTLEETNVGLSLKMKF